MQWPPRLARFKATTAVYRDYSSLNRQSQFKATVAVYLRDIRGSLTKLWPFKETTAVYRGCCDRRSLKMQSRALFKDAVACAV